ncbi:methyltransferase domain-containing protein [Nonomuraea sp. NPDC051941]|uniref:methyltransferase domain-containing protein n=1 Tax=Nonomuraea sp. NPDC051941 TaxID=3364373 RepID=UPI0037CC5DF8
MLAIAGLAVIGAAWLRRRRSTSCRCGRRVFVRLLVPRSFASCHRVCDVLNPRPGERILAVGLGAGSYALDVAKRLGTNGRLDLFDVRQEKLDRTMARARRQGLTNVATFRGDTRRLPYVDHSFDAACVIAAPGSDVSPQELARVLRPGGRLVIGLHAGTRRLVFGAVPLVDGHRAARHGSAGRVTLPARTRTSWEG